MARWKNNKMGTHVLYCFVLVVAMVSQTRGQSLTDAKNLATDLMQDYDKRLRPVLNQSLPVTINVTMHILALQVCFVD